MQIHKHVELNEAHITGKRTEKEWGRETKGSGKIRHMSLSELQ